MSAHNSFYGLRIRSDDFGFRRLEQLGKAQRFITGGFIEVIGGLKRRAAIRKEAAQAGPVPALEGVAGRTGEAADRVVETLHRGKVQPAKPRTGGPDGRK